MTIRPRRSVLYMPGSNARALEKAATLPADALILDLEDAVAPEAKDLARKLVCDAVRDRRFGKREVVIRVNGIDTPWGRQDMDAACAAGPDAILVPKVDDTAQVRAAEAAMARAPDGCALWLMIETPRAIFNALQIAGAGGRLACLVMGTNDLVKEMRARHTPGREALVAALNLTVMAARAHDLAVIDGVYNDIADSAGFSAACNQGRSMGFDGKTLIHPSQVEPCNAAFSRTRPKWSRHARSSPPLLCRKIRVKAPSPSTAGWWNSCTPKLPARPWPCPMPLRHLPRIERHFALVAPEC